MSSKFHIFFTHLYLYLPRLKKNLASVLLFQVSPPFSLLIVHSGLQILQSVPVMEGNKRIISTMIGAWIITTLLTEVPNTFSWEWIYYNIPFTTSEILKINVVIFTMGWFFLVFAPVRFIDFVRLIFRLDDGVREKYNRGIPSGCGIS